MRRAKTYSILPKNLKHLGSEIKKVCADYWDKKITEERFREIIYNWCDNAGLLEDESIINPTVIRVIGKKRTDLLKLILIDYIPIKNRME